MLWENIEAYYGSMDPRTFFIGRPTNMACHNLCIENKAPVGIELLLGLGAGYCVQDAKLPPGQINNMIKRLTNRMRWNYLFRNAPDNDNWIPGMYINSDKDPPEASPEIEACLRDLKRKLNMERRRYGRDIYPNLTRIQSSLIQRIRADNRYTVISTDKNCGLAIADTKVITQLGVSDHLSNSDTYKRLTEGQAHGQLDGVERLIASFISTHRDKLGDAEYTFLKRGLKRDRKNFGRFYTTPKIHKEVEREIPHPQLPHPLRPIVATCGTALANLSKWVDYKLQQLKPHILTYIKDSDEFLRYVKAFTTLLKGGKLPRNARLLTADAISMYTNIDTEHGLCILQLFLE